MGKIFTTKKINYTPFVVFISMVLLSAGVFFLLGFEIARWLTDKNYSFSFVSQIPIFLGLFMLIYYGIKFFKMENK